MTRALVPQEDQLKLPTAWKNRVLPRRGTPFKGKVKLADAETVAPQRLAFRKGAGNAVELGAVVAFGFSPLWLLAGASDVLRGTRLYLDELMATRDAGEGLAAFLAKRRPNWEHR